MHKVLLYGPPVNANNKRGYGGGMGGYIRNMNLYLEEFQFDDIELISTYHTINGQYNFGILTFPIRFIIDVFRIITSLIRVKPDGIHCLAHYRRALPRELALLFICKILNTPFLYQIRGGVFVDTYKRGNWLYKKGIKYILKNSKLILSQGKYDVDYLNSRFEIGASYFPNVVRDIELDQQTKVKLKAQQLSILFVGYCYRDKGVFELVDACKLAALSGMDIQLTFVGAEHIEFTNYLDLIEKEKLFQLNRMGKLPHDEVLNIFRNNDIYCYPSSHKGEGHNNSINEAMMMNLVIITTKFGFIEEILDDSSAYFLNEVSAQEIFKVIKEINSDRDVALYKANNAHIFLKNNLLSSDAKKNMYDHYKRLISN